MCKNDKLATLFLVFGLLLFSMIIKLPFISDNSSVIHVLPKENEIQIKGLRKEINIKKGTIIRIETKDIYYGGKWLDIIGKRLVVHTMGKKYNFDFETCGDKELAEIEQNFEKDNLPYHQLKKLFELYMQ